MVLILQSTKNVNHVAVLHIDARAVSPDATPLLWRRHVLECTRSHRETNDRAAALKHVDGVLVSAVRMVFGRHLRRVFVVFECVRTDVVQHNAILAHIAVCGVQNVSVIDVDGMVPDAPRLVIGESVAATALL